MPDTDQETKVWHYSRQTMRSSVFRIGTAIALVASVALYFGAFSSSTSLATTDPIANIRNETLGFEKIFAIGMPDRTDRKDTVVVAASYTGLRVDWIPGVAWESITPKARPTKWKIEKGYEPALGCWRAHLNVMQRIVSERISSALVFEDDVDWDILVKSQMTEYARGARLFQESTSLVPRTAYGDDWDMLWVGACETSPPADQEGSSYYVIEDDPTVAPMGRRHALWHGKPRRPEFDSNNTRVIFRPGYGVCLTGYAVSYEGARKILAALSLTPTNKAIDRKIGQMCGGLPGEPPFKCIAVYPPYFSMHRAAGPMSRDSDIERPFVDMNHPEYSRDIVYSASLNAPRLAAGADTARAQWKDVEEQEMSLDSQHAGYGILRSFNGGIDDSHHF